MDNNNNFLWLYWNEHVYLCKVNSANIQFGFMVVLSCELEMMAIYAEICLFGFFKFENKYFFYYLTEKSTI